MGRERSGTVELQTRAYKRRLSARDRELEKRAKLRAELQHELHQHVTPGVRLGPKVRAEIREKVTRGLMTQSMWPKSAGVRPRGGE